MANNATLMCSEDDSNNMKHQLLTEQYLLTPDRTITATQTMYLLVYAYSCASTHIPNWIHVFLPTAPYSCSWPYITTHSHMLLLVSIYSYSRPAILTHRHLFLFTWRDIRDHCHQFILTARYSCLPPYIRRLCCCLPSGIRPCHLPQRQAESGTHQTQRIPRRDLDVCG